MRDFFSSVFRGLRDGSGQYLTECYKRWFNLGIQPLAGWLIGSSNQVLRRSDLFASVASPMVVHKGVSVVGFAAEPYRTVQGAGRIDGPLISEMLARFRSDDGRRVSNEGFFQAVHDEGRHRQTDAILVSAGIDCAVQHGHLSTNRAPAFNIFSGSLDRDFFDLIEEKLAGYGYGPSSIVLEILEYQTPITADHIEVVREAAARGFCFSLDDVDPRKAFDQQRVAAFGEYARILKLSRAVVHDYRLGRYPDIGRDLYALLEKNPGLAIVAEGVPHSRQSEISHLPLSWTQSRFEAFPV